MLVIIIVGVIILMGERFLIGSNEARYKIILVGDVNVGKTAMFWRYTQGQFLASKQTLVTTIDFKMKCITVNNKPIKLYVWDTAGSEKYRSIVSTYFKGCHGVVIVFDLSRQASFKNAIQSWHQLAKSKTNGAVFILVGNKSDLDIRVNTDDVRSWCDQQNIAYIETSVKQNKNVNEVFDSIARKIYLKENNYEKSQSFSLNQVDKKQEKTGCC